MESYFAAIEDEQRRKDCEALARLMTKATKERPKMWGKSIVGFGSYHYKYESGREGDSCLVGFSSRKGDISVYGLGMSPAQEALLKKLGSMSGGRVAFTSGGSVTLTLRSWRNLSRTSRKPRCTRLVSLAIDLGTRFKTAYES